MSKIKMILVFLFIGGLATAQATQDSISIRWKLNWKNAPLELNKTYQSNSDSLQLTKVKFYISGIKILFEDKSDFIQKDSYHLIDIENTNSLKTPICKKSDKTISKITFNIGIDSLQSVSGALLGDLDATKGMYWAWQSGFINLKIEGKSNSCQTRNNQFHFHIGGFLVPNYAIREIEISSAKISSKFKISGELPIEVDVSKLFEEIQLKEINSIMIPGKQAMKIADLSTKMFVAE